MAQHIGRALQPDEEVHHLNHDPLDNRIENLIILPRARHIALHAHEKRRYPDTKACALCGASFAVNPKKRGRHKCCSKTCAQTMRVRAALRARGIAA